MRLKLNVVGIVHAILTIYQDALVRREGGYR